MSGLDRTRIQWWTAGVILAAVVLADHPLISTILLACALGLTALPWVRSAPSLRIDVGLQIFCLLLALLISFTGRSSNPDAEDWESSQRKHLEARLTAVQDDVSLLRTTIADIHDRSPEWDNDRLRLDGWLEAWPERWAESGTFELGVVQWRDHERVAWGGRVEPFSLDGLPAAGEPALVQQGRNGWVWRGSTGTGDGVLEWQVRLSRDLRDDPASRLEAEEQFRLQVLSSTEPRPLRWQGNAMRGLSVVADIVLDSTPGDMELPVLRVHISSPSQKIFEAGHSTRHTMGVLLFSSLALLILGRRQGWPALLIVAWILRGIWARADIFHQLPSGWPRIFREVGPDSLASLVDPTYFATPWGWGLFASTADAMLTAALVLLTAAGLTPLIKKRVQSEHLSALGEILRGGMLGLLFSIGLLILAALAGELATNAHARLIGPRVPLTSATFWGLHLTLLLMTIAAVLVFSGFADRLRGRRPLSQGAMATGVSIVVAVAVFGRTGSAEAIVLPPIVLALWGASAVMAGADRTLRRLVWLLPLLALIVWNHQALIKTYDRVEEAWLSRKIDEITSPRSDWARFLLEDLLAEMAADEAVLHDPPRAHAAAADELWRDWPAYALWEGSGLDDLGMACNVEILTGEGGIESRFASGLFRDIGYEIVSRDEWERGRPIAIRPGQKQDVYFQSEQRRYATGDEWILRGEVARAGTDGWISLELPVRSGRVQTMQANLRPASQSRGGYTPRLDVDRPLLLLRRETNGWRGDDSADMPDQFLVDEQIRSAVDADKLLEIKAGDHQWRCLWRPAPPGHGNDVEGYLLGVQAPGVGDWLLDLSRLILLNLLMLAAIGLLVGVGRLPWRRRVQLPGFQERFLLLSFLLGLLPLVMAGTFIDRLSREWLADDAREQSRVGLDTAREQLQGLLAEQARALAASDYISDLLASRFAGSRPLGPFATRQAMVFSADGELLLDETLSNLDDDEATLVLDVARSTSLVMMRDAQGTYLGTVIPVSLNTTPSLADAEGITADLAGPGDRPRDGYFFYRQRIDTDLLAGLAEVVQGEVVLYVEGEAVLASHPDHVFSGLTHLMLPPRAMSALQQRSGGSLLVPAGPRDLSWQGLLALPSLVNSDDDHLHVGRLPAVLTTAFPARGRDFASQRERTVLFLAGLATLIFLLATVLGLSLAWRIFDPVRVLVHATHRLAAGDYAAPLPESTDDELGKLGAAFGAMRDDLQETQSALAERERFLASLLDSVPVGVVVFGVADQVVSLNPAAETMLDGFFADTTGTTDDRASLLRAGFLRVLPAGEGEAELTTPGGDKTLRGRLAPLTLPDGRRDQMIVFEDITEFLATKRLAINAQLARQVAHEVKNPLTPIQLSVQFLQQAWRDNAEGMDEIVESTTRQVLEQVELLRSIATEFSLLGRPETLTLEPCDFRQQVHATLDRYRGASSLQLQERDCELPLVAAHGESLAKVLGNLMENSLQAVGDPQNLVLELDWSVTDRVVTLIWRDNGPGLADEVADRLFDLYFSTKSHGTGLGLPICRNLLSRMDGLITLRNREDISGAEATVTLRRIDAPPLSSSGQDTE